VAVGAAVLLAILALVLWFCCVKKRRASGIALDDPEALANRSSRRAWFTPLISGKAQNDQYQYIAIFQIIILYIMHYLILEIL